MHPFQKAHHFKSIISSYSWTNSQLLLTLQHSTEEPVSTHVSMPGFCLARSVYGFILLLHQRAIIGRNLKNANHFHLYDLFLRSLLFFCFRKVHLHVFFPKAVIFAIFNFHITFYRHYGIQYYGILFGVVTISHKPFEQEQRMFFHELYLTCIETKEMLGKRKLLLCQAKPYKGSKQAICSYVFPAHSIQERLQDGAN